MRNEINEGKEGGKVKRWWKRNVRHLA